MEQKYKVGDAVFFIETKSRKELPATVFRIRLYKGIPYVELKDESGKIIYRPESKIRLQ